MTSIKELFYQDDETPGITSRLSAQALQGLARMNVGSTELRAILTDMDQYVSGQKPAYEWHGKSKGLRYIEDLEK